MADDFSFEITKSLGEIAQSKGGWAMELNMVSWGGRDPKYDIRSWSPDHQKMGKGITMTHDEIISLQKLLAKIEL